jgi:hypothetical protein
VMMGDMLWVWLVIPGGTKGGTPTGMTHYLDASLLLGCGRISQLGYNQCRVSAVNVEEGPPTKMISVRRTMKTLRKEWKLVEQQIMLDTCLIYVNDKCYIARLVVNRSNNREE